MLHLIGDHLWQSTVCVGVAWLLTLALRKNHAGIRFWVWFAASMKFLVPFAALVAIGTALPWKPAPIATNSPIEMFELVSQPFSTGVTTPATAAPQPEASWTRETLTAVGLGALWAMGTLAVVRAWLARWRRIRAAVAAATADVDSREQLLLARLANERGLGVPELRRSAGAVEPAVVGIRRPVLLWPAGISSRLTDAQVEAILSHELAHIARRDNLLALLHMGVQALFWFHPLVWIIGTRLVHERERACDEDVVLRSGHREAYAEGILRTCEHCVESSLPCAAGVTGADLKARVAAIMRGHASAPLTSRHRVWIVAGAVIVMGAPLLLGAARGSRTAVVPTRSSLAGPPFRQAHTPAVGGVEPAFEVASVRRHHPDDPAKRFDGLAGGKVNLINFTLQDLVTTSYQTQNYRLIGGPDWMRSDAYDVIAKADGEPSGPERLGMIRQLLADRFKLVMHTETRDLPIYKLVVARNDGKLGPQLKPSTCGGLPPKPGVPLGEQGTCGGWVNLANGATLQTRARMTALANVLGRIAAIGRPVIDQTGLTGEYAYELKWTPEQAAGAPAPADAVSVFTALQEQLGLKLEASTGPLEIYVIDSVQRPTDNNADVPSTVTAPSARFEVASVKPIPASAGGSAVPVVLPGRLEFRGATLKNLIAGAYESQVTMILETPGYEKRLNDHRFNIEAKTNLPQGNPREQLRSSIYPMLRDLLAERFKLRLHPEMREVRAYALIVGNNGPRFKAADPEVNAREVRTRLTAGPGRIIFDNAPLTGLANTLAGMIQVPVVDRTGLAGLYNFTWQWILDNGEEITPAQAMENLGLKLEDTREPVRFMVVDHAEMPTEN
ncbi:MAG: TIGR03435 family protein [Vicinamibacterales bacterium]